VPASGRREPLLNQQQRCRAAAPALAAKRATAGRSGVAAPHAFCAASAPQSRRPSQSVAAAAAAGGATAAHVVHNNCGVAQPLAAPRAFLDATAPPPPTTPAAAAQAAHRNSGSTGSRSRTPCFVF